MLVCFREPHEPKRFKSDLEKFDNLHCVSTPSGKVTSALMKLWFEEDFYPNVLPGSLLLVDSWGGFNQMIEEHQNGANEIEFGRIPEHATKWFQPLDNEYFMQFKVIIETNE
jgi:hypothetical protein